MNADDVSLPYVIVSPVKDEARYVEHTLRSVTAQSAKPALWVIVDDGSTDDTEDIVTRYARQYPFIRLVHHPGAGERRAGTPVMRAFEYGRSHLGDVPHEFIVKLDCDLSFGPDYFASLLSRFDRDPRLGIASGVYLEVDSEGDWRPIPMPPYHAFGASKMVRRRCFDEIGGFPVAPGWDTADEIRAMARGWRTGNFSDLEVRHHKREGSGVGPIRTSRMHGQIYYKTGGDPLFFVLKTLHRTMASPPLINAGALAYGYATAAISREPRLVTREEARTYRRLLRRRLFRTGHTPELEPLRIGE